MIALNTYRLSFQADLVHPVYLDPSRDTILLSSAEMLGQLLCTGQDGNPLDVEPVRLALDLRDVPAKTRFSQVLNADFFFYSKTYDPVIKYGSFKEVAILFQPGSELERGNWDTISSFFIYWYKLMECVQDFS